jgi:hypothetical protein
MHTKFWFKIPEEKKTLGRHGADCRIILKLILKNYRLRVWTGFIYLCLFIFVCICLFVYVFVYR